MLTEDYIKSKGLILTKTSQTQSKNLDSIFTAATIDIFISHAYEDREMIEGLKHYFEQELGLSIFVDWDNNYIDLNRDNICDRTAKAIKYAIGISKVFIYVHSKNSTISKWNKWELGYADGKKVDLLGIFLVDSDLKLNNSHEEFLGIYPVLNENHIRRYFKLPEIS